MVREIVYLGDPVLRKPCDPVTEVTEDVRALADDMIETMIAADGVGLAAPQVAVPIQLAVVDVRLDEEDAGLFKVDGKDAAYDDWMPLVFINPDFELGEHKGLGTEGCLSIPDVRAEVNRPLFVRTKLQLIDGKEIEVEADGLLARALQHEADHLHGILFIDRLSAAAKLRARRDIKRAKRDW